MVVKEIYGKFKYYLTEFNTWTGLTDNARKFSSMKEVGESINMMQRYCGKDEVIKFIECGK